MAGFVGVDFDLDYAQAEEARFRRIEIASVIGVVLLSLLLGHIYARYHFSQQEELQHHYESSMNDSLTGLLNRRGADAAVRKAMSGRGELMPNVRTQRCWWTSIISRSSMTRRSCEGDAVMRASPLHCAPDCDPETCRRGWGVMSS